MKKKFLVLLGFTVLFLFGLVEPRICNPEPVLNDIAGYQHCLLLWIPPFYAFYGSITCLLIWSAIGIRMLLTRSNRNSLNKIRES